MHIQTSNQEKFKLGFGDYTCNWGLHMCGLYETEEERDKIIFGLFTQGCDDGNLQLYCPVERTANDFKEKFSLHNPKHSANLEDKNSFVINSAKELYYPDGIFSPKAMDTGLNNFYVESQKNGYRNIRATAEMCWALNAIPGVEHLMVYESRLNYFIPGKPWISICLYNMNKFSGSQIMNVLRTHPYAVNKGIVSQNPYYVNPDQWLAENAPEYLYH
jgi:hypothetical protein